MRQLLLILDPSPEPKGPMGYRFESRLLQHVRLNLSALKKALNRDIRIIHVRAKKRYIYKKGLGEHKDMHSNIIVRSLH